jgi:uncharacterized protein
MATLIEMPSTVRTNDNFIRTFTGRKFWPLDPRPHEIDVRDIAHSLSLQCRWTGHTDGFYSVAEHSIRVSLEAQRMAFKLSTSRTPSVISHVREIALWGLLHDAPEAYIADLARPVKHFTAFGEIYKPIERRLMDAVIERFQLIPHAPSIVKDADAVLLNSEGHDLMGVEEHDAEEWHVDGPRLAETIEPMDPQFAEYEFIRRFEALMAARKVNAAAESF